MVSRVVLWSSVGHRVGRGAVMRSPVRHRVGRGAVMRSLVRHRVGRWAVVWCGVRRKQQQGEGTPALALGLVGDADAQAGQDEGEFKPIHCGICVTRWCWRTGNSRNTSDSLYWLVFLPAELLLRCWLCKVRSCSGLMTV